MTDHMYNVAVNTDKTQYISFTAIDKIGINPRSTYSTPVGIYCYPLNKASGEPSAILDSMYRYNSFDDIPRMRKCHCHHESASRRRTQYQIATAQIVPFFFSFQ